MSRSSRHFKRTEPQVKSSSSFVRDEEKVFDTRTRSTFIAWFLPLQHCYIFKNLLVQHLFVRLWFLRLLWLTFRVRGGVGWRGTSTRYFYWFWLSTPRCDFLDLAWRFHFNSPSNPLESTNRTSFGSHSLFLVSHLLSTFHWRLSRHEFLGERANCLLWRYCFLSSDKWRRRGRWRGRGVFILLSGVEGRRGGGWWWRSPSTSVSQLHILWTERSLHALSGEVMGAVFGVAAEGG